MHLAIRFMEPSVRVETGLRLTIPEKEPIQVRRVNSAICEFGGWQVNRQLRETFEEIFSFPATVT
jgi:hypothetical protein